MMPLRTVAGDLSKIALYGCQIAVGLAALVLGHALLTAPGWAMPGAGNILAGLLLLSPRGGRHGAGLLVALAVAAATANVRGVLPDDKRHVILMLQTPPVGEDRAMPEIIARGAKPREI